MMAARSTASRAARIAAILLCALGFSVMARMASAQTPQILVVSQPDPRDSGEFIDLAYYIQRELQSNGLYEGVVYKKTAEAVQKAVADGKITQADLEAPRLTKDAAHKLAQALGVPNLLFLSARETKDGVSARAEMERVAGQQSWVTVFAMEGQPVRGKGKRPSLIEGILTQVSNIMQRLGAPSTPIPVGKPVDPKTGKTVDLGPAGPGKNPPDKPTTAGGTTGGPAKPEPGPTKPEPVPTKPPKNPNVVSANQILVDKFRRQGDLTNMLVALRKAVNDTPRDAILRRQLAQCYLDRGWQATARDEVNRALALAPNDAPLHRLMGDVLMAGRDPDAALAAYQDAIRLDPKDGSTYVALGDAYGAASKPDEALKAYDQGARADSHNPAPHLRMARTYAQMGRFDQCAAELSAARQLAVGEDPASFTDDYSAILSVTESGLRESLARIQSARQALRDGTRTREQAYGEVQNQNKRAQAISDFLDALQPPPAIGRAVSLYGQAAMLVLQASESAMQYMETQESRRDDDMVLFRLEAERQLTEAHKRLTTLSAPVKQ